MEENLAGPDRTAAAREPYENGNGASDWKEVMSFFRTISLLIILAIFLRATVVEAFKIPSESMKPTLQKGDHILVNKLSYGLRMPFNKETIYEYSSPSRGDIVVFTQPDIASTPEDESKDNIIKRVVAVGGDTIKLVDTTLFVNGREVDEAEYARYDLSGIESGEYGPVPPGHIFLLGDNRDHSRDSRFWPYPFLETKRVKGRAFIIYWSWYSLTRIATILR